MYQDYRDDPLPSRSPLGRFHSRESAASVTYLAASPQTAWKEVTARWSADRDAYWMAEVRVRLNKVADLTEAGTPERLGIDQQALTDASHDRCQRLAERLRAQGFEGIWTFSRADRPDGRQLVVFLDRVSRQHIRIHSLKPVRDVLPRP